MLCACVFTSTLITRLLIIFIKLNRYYRLKTTVVRWLFIYPFLCFLLCSFLLVIVNNCYSWLLITVCVGSGQLQDYQTVECYSSSSDCNSQTNGVSVRAIDCCNKTGGGYIRHSSLRNQCGGCIGKGTFIW